MRVQLCYYHEEHPETGLTQWWKYSRAREIPAGAVNIYLKKKAVVDTFTLLWTGKANLHLMTLVSIHFLLLLLLERSIETQELDNICM